jgi:hypothetical protein
MKKGSIVAANALGLHWTKPQARARAKTLGSPKHVT